MFQTKYFLAQIRLVAISNIFLLIYYIPIKHSSDELFSDFLRASSTLFTLYNPTIIIDKSKFIEKIKDKIQ